MSRGGSQHTMKMGPVRYEESITCVPFSEEATQPPNSILTGLSCLSCKCPQVADSVGTAGNRFHVRGCRIGATWLELSPKCLSRNAFHG
jgi:hypothetical protein